jgi:hypothetical protein
LDTDDKTDSASVFWAWVVEGEAYNPVAPSSTIAGVFGMHRIIGVEGGRSEDSEGIVTPAAIEIILALIGKTYRARWGNVSCDFTTDYRDDMGFNRD